jgi:hypothetical protein
MSPEKTPTRQRRYRCRLAQQHPGEVGPYLDMMPTDDLHDAAVLQAYELEEGEETTP